MFKRYLLNTYHLPHLVHIIFEWPVTSNKDSRLEKYLSQSNFLTLILLWQAARCSCQYFSKTGSLSALILSDMRRRRSKWEEELTSNLKFLPFQALNLEILVVYNFYYNSLKHVILVFNFMLIFQGSHLKPFKPNVLSFHLLNQTGILPLVEVLDMYVPVLPSLNFGLFRFYWMKNSIYVVF